MAVLSYDDIRDLLSYAINRGSLGMSPNYWIRDVYPDSFVYQDYSTNALWKRAYSIDAKNSVTLGDPEQVIEQTNYAPVQMAAFSLDGASSTAGDYVLRTGKIFEAGDYPDKYGGFSLTEEELRAAVEGFEPVRIDSEHRPSLFDNKLGTLESVALDAQNPRVMLGTVKLPRWLNDVLADTALTVSTQWDRASKRLDRLALTVDPRVPDAVLMSAYAQFAGARHSTADVADLQQIHDLVVKQGAACAPAKMSNKEKKTMSDKSPIERFLALFEGRSADPDGTGSDAGAGEGTPAPTPPVPAPTPTPTPQPVTMSAEYKALQARMEAVEEERRAERAVEFANKAIRAGKRAPAEYNSLVTKHLQSSRDDVAHPQKVTFSGIDGEGKPVAVEYASRTAQLEAELEAAPVIHSLTTDYSDRLSDAVVLFNSATPSNDSQKTLDDEVEAYMNSTPEGRKALADYKAAQNGK